MPYLLHRILPWFILLSFASLCFFSQREKAVTVDEFSHFPSGIYNLVTLDWRMDKESPPLVKCFPAITALITKPFINTKLFKENPNTWSLGYDFMFRNWQRYKDLFQSGRCSIILLGCLLGLLLYRFGSELYGKSGGLLALFLYAFNPNIIAHSRLTTIDMGASLAIFFSVYCLWGHLKKRKLSSAVLAGIALGLAQLCKFTALLLYPVFIIVLAVSTVRNVSNRKRGEEAHSNHFLREAGNMSSLTFVGQIILIVLVSLLVINVGYLFSGTFTPLEDYPLLSQPLKYLSSSLMGRLPMPLPCDYISGFDSQLSISKGNNPFYASYLMGKHSLTGWWYYYIIAFIVKNPLSLLVISLFTVLAWLKRRTGGPDLETSLCVWLTFIIYFIYSSLFVRVQIGIRFLLPVFPFLFLASGYLCNVGLTKGRAGRIITAIILAAYLIPAVSVFPDYLSYFNIGAGGPGNGHRWLLDSNLDWGQDLPKLKKYMEKNGINKIKLGYFGRVDPGIYDINYSLPEREPEKGLCAISINFLAGRPYYLLEPGRKKLIYADSDYFKEYRSFKAVDVIGNTIHILDIE